jgi:3-hydroxyacyl-CoA dehydrogenase / 3-hydroxy-2-methylbutyryl-CoA dehydrogenase
MDIDGNVALVTGGASGLGEATTRHLHRLGAHVVVFDRDEARAKSLVADLGDRADHVAGDATDEGDTRDAVDTAAGLGELRIVCAIAGGGAQGQRTVARDGTPHDLQLFVDTMHLNMLSTFNTLRFSAAAMDGLEPANADGERGVIVLTGSLAGYEGQIGTLAYGAAKAGVIGMTLIAARDLAAMGVRVNCIAPGTMNTPAWDAASPDVKAALEAKVPFPRRLGHPEEFASLAAHLVTNGYINGHVVRLDGGIRFDPR